MKTKTLIHLCFLCAVAVFTGCVAIPPQAPIGTLVKIDLKKGVAEWNNNKDTSIGRIFAKVNPITGESEIEISNISTLLNTNNAATAGNTQVDLLKEVHLMNNDTMDKTASLIEKGLEKTAAAGVKGATGL